MHAIAQHGAEVELKACEENTQQGGCLPHCRSLCASHSASHCVALAIKRIFSLTSLTASLAPAELRVVHAVAQHGAEVERHLLLRVAVHDAVHQLRPRGEDSHGGERAALCEPNRRVEDVHGVLPRLWGASNTKNGGVSWTDSW